jgi:hypothetical protein
MHLKLQFNKFLLFLFASLLLYGDLSFSNEQNPPNEVSADENHDTKDLNELLKKYNTNPDESLDSDSKVKNLDSSTVEVDNKMIEEMRPSENPVDVAETRALKNSKDIFSNLKSPEKKISQDFSNSVRILLEPIQKLSDFEIQKQIQLAIKDSPAREFLDKHPKYIDFAIKLIKDKESIPSMAKILDNKNRLIQFMGLMLFTFILGIFLKRFMHKEGRSFIKAAFYFIVRSYIMFSLRVFLVYLFYKEEFGPVIKLVKQSFL